MGPSLCFPSMLLSPLGFPAKSGSALLTFAPVRLDFSNEGKTNTSAHTLHSCIIITVAHPRHTHDDLQFPQAMQIAGAGIRAALIGMHQHLFGRGVRMNYLDYWCAEMLDAEVEGTKIPVRFDPFDVSTGYAYIDGKWRECKCVSD